LFGILFTCKRRKTEETKRNSRARERTLRVPRWFL
jgi:hypothetical protein